ncbi:uncharacterized protein LOC126355541 [Schistocerca gregaria]|uniref:uncharacterized protein LOC126355541 n=1 Tax=Schistocerca gregaria TaxID=7010 RepID=UPI00211EF7CE|nr:uncharacterized protein LOC126355541 [Schistocerca gregaria]
MSTWTTARRVPSQHSLRNILVASFLLLTPSATCRQEDDTADGTLAGASVLHRSLTDCAVHESPLLCLRALLLRALDRALLTDRLPLADGVTLVRQASADISPGDAAEVPAATAGPGEWQVSPDGLLRRLATLFTTHSLQLQLPGTFITSLLPEGRSKGGGLKKYGSVLLLGAMMKAAVLAIAFKAIALLAGTALLVAKVAFVLAAVVGLSKLLGGGGGGGDHDKSGYEYVKHPALAHAYAHPVPHEYGHSGGGGGGGGGVMHYEANAADGTSKSTSRTSLGVGQTKRVQENTGYRKTTWC